MKNIAKHLKVEIRVQKRRVCRSVWETMIRKETRAKEDSGQTKDDSEGFSKMTIAEEIWKNKNSISNSKKDEKRRWKRKKNKKNYV